MRFEDVRVPSDVGDLAGWWLPGTPGTTGVLLLHGRRRGERAETLRVLPTVADAGRSVLVLAYRNHRDSPASPDGFYHYGSSEAEDALAGARFLAEHGVRDVVLYGFSMGGATALEALKRWPSTGVPSVAGMVLDAPLIDPAAVTEARVRRAGVPFPRAWSRATLALAAWRSGVRWRALDQRRNAQDVEVPVLLMAGTDDQTVPVEVIDAFAARLAGRVTYHRVDGADHIEAWNLDPDAYARKLGSFLAGLSAGRSG
jgi:pimeloyl-ACP methyl ester carboxylesterase